MTIEWTQRYTWRRLLCEHQDALGGHNQVSLEMHWEAMIEWTWRPWSVEFGDELEGHDWVNLEMHLEAIIERVWRCTRRPRPSWTQRCTCRPWSSEFEDAVGGRDRVTQRSTWRPWSSEFGDALGGHDWARLKEYLEAVNRRRARCRDCIHQLANSQPSECDEMTLPLSFYGELGWWRSIL